MGAERPAQQRIYSRVILFIGYCRTERFRSLGETAAFSAALSAFSRLEASGRREAFCKVRSGGYVWSDWLRNWVYGGEMSISAL